MTLYRRSSFRLEDVQRIRLMCTNCQSAVHDIQRTQFPDILVRVPSIQTCSTCDTELNADDDDQQVILNLTASLKAVHSVEEGDRVWGIELEVLNKDLSDNS